ncbi:MAG: glycosyltransferase [Caldilineaceae bacterium]
MTERNENELKPTPDTAKSEEVKPAEVRAEQVRKAKQRLAGTPPPAGNSNPIVADETYGALREDNRVVMRHQIALNLETFRAAPDDFVARPTQEFPPLAVRHAPFMSVIVPNYNGARFLPTVLDALRRQTFRDFEAIVIDDAGTDESVALVERDYPEVRLLVNRRNVGFVRACNIAADAADGRAIVLLNSDTEPGAHLAGRVGAPSVHTRPHRRHLQAAALRRPHGGSTPRATCWAWTAFPQPRRLGDGPGQYDGATDVFSGCGGATATGAMCGRRWAALTRISGCTWRMWTSPSAPAGRLACGLRPAGARVYHHLSASGGDVLSSYYVGRNTIWTIAKNMPRRLLLENLPRIVAAQLRVQGDAQHSRGSRAATAAWADRRHPRAAAPTAQTPHHPGREAGRRGRDPATADTRVDGERAASPDRHPTTQFPPWRRHASPTRKTWFLLSGRRVRSGRRCAHRAARQLRRPGPDHPCRLRGHDRQRQDRPLRRPAGRGRAGPRPRHPHRPQGRHHQPAAPVSRVAPGRFCAVGQRGRRPAQGADRRGVRAEHGRLVAKRSGGLGHRRGAHPHAAGDGGLHHLHARLRCGRLHQHHGQPGRARAGL